MSTSNQSFQKQGEDLKQAARAGMKQAGEKLSKAIDENVSDATKQQANQIKNEVKQSLNQAQSQIQSQVKGMKASMESGFGPWMRQQQQTATAYWSEIMRQPNFAKGLLGALLFTNLICPLFFMNRAEGVVTFLTYLAVSVASHFLSSSTWPPVPRDSTWCHPRHRWSTLMSLCPFC